MPQSIEDFRSALQTHTEWVRKIREHIKNEEATKVSLILPFVALLGYDDKDPTEVAAEHSSDFSDKYKNKVDYAILRNKKPVIAIECKSIGNAKKDDVGQLKAYFNATKDIKLGILTDGISYQFYVDSIEPNMMDQDPFLEIDFNKSSQHPISESATEVLYTLRKEFFEPDTVAEQAKKNITHREFYKYLSTQFNSPSVDFTKFLLTEVNKKYISKKAIETYIPIVKAAFDEVFTSSVLRRLDIEGFSTKLPPRIEPQPPVPAVEPPVGTESNGIETTEAELAAFEAIKLRLAYLSSGNKTLFEAISKLAYKDFAGKMVVYYQQVQKGRIAELYENKDGSIRFVITDGGDLNPSTNLSDFDERLKAIFEKRAL